MALLAQEGIMRTVQYSGGVPLSLLPQETPGTLTDNSLIDTWLPKVTAKPAGVGAGKDNNYGYGLPFGTLISQTINSVTTSDMSGLISAVLTMGMLGIMMKSMSKMNLSTGSTKKSITSSKKNLIPVG
jgi:hypothetical protein